MGVRLLLVQDGRVLLVRHSYQSGWFLPGGGVRKKESLERAARREAWEEAGARLGELHFFGIYSNLTLYKSDHVAVFVCDDLTIEGTSDYEIEETRFFAVDCLPRDLGEGSRRRIEEYFSGNHEPGVSTW